MNTHLTRVLVGTALVTTAFGSAWFGAATAHADTPLPVCHMEDGSDVDPALLPCVWTNDGKQWLTYTDHSVLIGDTPMAAFPCIPAPFIVIPGLVPGVVQCGAQR